MEWMFFRGDDFLSLMIIRRYLKLAINNCIENNLMDLKISEIEMDKVPYKLLLIPVKYPTPDKLRLI
ncbi:hypothetical protein [Flavobacterium sp.]|uniref:hypothetical protein n=1 Tax=Flavobacterium sp. TaxID=239 RepID=UPI0038FC1DDA